MKSNRIILCLGILGILFLFCLVWFIRQKAHHKNPVKIALVTTLTGPASTAGIYTRDGALLAIEQANATGGVNGRLVEALVRDDKADPALALKLDAELMEEGVVAFLGHYLSSVSVKVVPLMNEHQMVMLSLGAATGDLYGLDDQFMRVTLPNPVRTPITARETFNRMGVRRVAVVYDRSNAAYTESVNRLFCDEFNRLGGEVMVSLAFHSKEKFSAPSIAQQLLDSGADGIFLITDAMHGALLCQHIRRLNASIPISACAWACCVPDFILDGGRAVDGVISIVECDVGSGVPKYIQFKESFKQRFGHEPSLHAQDAYTITKLLLKGLEQTTDPAKLKEAILGLGGIEGMNGFIGMDRTGEPIRSVYVMQIVDGKEVVIAEVNALAKEIDALEH